MLVDRFYLCIDLKTFFASVECVERGLDPFKVNLVVADPAKGSGAICLAISPALKNQGIRNRCRVFEIPNSIQFITALPRMKKYIEYSANIYAIYLKYFAPSDIFAYSIDEMFIDVTGYLSLYETTPLELAKKMIAEIYQTLGITATAGIGTNMYLAKVALDITAKHVASNIGFLDEKMYKETLWFYRPLSDFWQIGRGIEKKLNKLGIFDMHGISTANPKKLYEEFGVIAEYLIDHSNGIEPTTIAQIKAYKPKNMSISLGQILFSNYQYQQVGVVIKEMVETISLELIDKNLVAGTIFIYVGYANSNVKSTGGTSTLDSVTNVYSLLVKEALAILERTTKKDELIRRLSVGVGSLKDPSYEQYNMFIDLSLVQKEQKLEQTINKIKKKYGKNAILRGMNFEESATQRTRNLLIGGHNSGEE